MGEPRFVMIAGVSRSGKSALAKALSRESGYATVRSSRLREAVCRAVPDWDYANWQQRSNRPDEDEKAVNAIRTVFEHVSTDSSRLVVLDEYFHEKRSRELVLEAVPGDMRRGFVLLDIDYGIYEARYGSGREPRRRLGATAFAEYRARTQWPGAAEGFARTIYVRIGDLIDDLSCDAPCDTLSAGSDREYRGQTLPQLIRRISGVW